MRPFLAFLLCASILSSCSAPSGDERSRHDPVDSILQTLTLEQKVGQMVQLNVEMFIVREEGSLIRPVRLDTPRLLEAIDRYGVGSIMNAPGGAITLEEWRYITQTIRDLSLPQDGNIPVIYAFDAVHGANYVSGSTIFPHQLCMAATWNDSLARRMGEVTASECRSAGVPWIFSPILDVARQPLWVQFFETFGEDVYLTSRMGEALTEGYQEGKSPVAACAKHFVGYGFPFTGKDRTPVHIGERTLREIHLPPFKRAIDVGLKSIMIGSNEIDGRPLLANRYWVRDVLRGELGFEGVLISDWADVRHLADWHKVAEDTLEATNLALEAGLDMAMVPNDYSFYHHVLELVKLGRVTEERIDESARRILQLKWDMGLFEEKAFNAPIGTPTHQKAAYEAAVEGITLLKNENEVLPLSPDKSVIVTGPGADDLTMLAGAWSRTWQGRDTLIDQEGHLTVQEALSARWASSDFHFFNGCSVDSLTDLGSAMRGATNYDVVVAVMGTQPATEKPGDISDLSLPKAQVEYVKAFKRMGKEVVVVLLEDRPRVVADLVSHCDAVIMAYRPGPKGSEALADLLIGKRNFSGKLPFTYPSAVNNLMTYDHKHPEVMGPDWGPTVFDPQWEFGHGLSYTDFAYSDLDLDKESYARSGTIRFSVKVKNTGERAGKEVVQVYVTDEVASITPAVKRLRAFRKIHLEAGEEKQVSFSIPVERLAFVGLENSWVVEPGKFTVNAGGLEKRFEVE